MTRFRRNKKFSTIPEENAYKEQTSMPKVITEEEHVEKNLEIMFKEYAKQNPNKSPMRKGTFDTIQNKTDAMSLKAWLSFYQDIVTQSKLLNL